MKRFLDRHPSTAVVISVVALVMATVGTGYAALKLPKNSVGTKQLKANSVTTAKIKKNAVTGAKVKKRTLTGSDINLNKLGTVPSAATAEALSPLEAIHLVGTAGEPGFEGGAANFGPVLGVNTQAIGFYKDHEGVVHLVGAAKAGEGGVIFRLPSGFRPTSGIVEIFEAGGIFILGPGVEPAADGLVLAFGAAPGEGVSLSGITFRAGT